jgi:membrane protease subunit (stomatin/prohibitin family)
MGLIKAATGALGGTLADQWKEYFYCDSMDADVLMTKGSKRTSKRSSNTKGEENVISDGSGIAVADGQCMIIVENGKVLDVCAEPGAYTYNTGTSPSIFGGKFLEGLRGIVQESWRRFQFGGDAGKDQRIYYFNIKEIQGNKYGTPNPVPFRVVDRNIGLDVDISIRCNGEYSYRIVNPMLFYTNVAGNVSGVYTRDQIDSMLKSELLTALQPAFAKISELGVRYSALPGHTQEIADALNEVLSKKWLDLRGIEVYSFGVNSVSASKEDEDMIKQLQKTAVYRDPNMAAATLVGSQADAMRAAAANSGGAMTGFMGFGMAQQAGGANAKDLFAMGQQQAANVGNTDAASGAMPSGAASSPETSTQGSWTCPSCGTSNTGKFCSECGAAKPAEASWTCPSCGTSNTGKFCSECGKPRS